MSTFGCNNRVAVGREIVSGLGFAVLILPALLLTAVTVPDLAPLTWLEPAVIVAMVTW